MTKKNGAEEQVSFVSESESLYLACVRLSKKNTHTKRRVDEPPVSTKFIPEDSEVIWISAGPPCGGTRLLGPPLFNCLLKYAVNCSSGVLNA